jgi:hypothetical protein
MLALAGGLHITIETDVIKVNVNKSAILLVHWFCHVL